MNSKARNRASKRQAILKLTLRNNPEASLRRSNGLLPILDSRISFKVVPVDDCVEEPVSQRRYSSTTKRDSGWCVDYFHETNLSVEAPGLTTPTSRGMDDSFAGNC